MTIWDKILPGEPLASLSFGRRWKDLQIPLLYSVNTKENGRDLLFVTVVEVKYEIILGYCHTAGHC